ncbi:MAG TPA: hypothetical protein VGC68_03260 [Enterovirga sp.]
MADQDSDPKRRKDSGSAADTAAGDCSRGPERDFGDSAGYGTGGSALDFHDVGDEEANPVKGKRNPLDEVMKQGDEKSSARSPGGS